MVELLPRKHYRLGPGKQIIKTKKYIKNILFGLLFLFDDFSVSVNLLYFHTLKGKRELMKKNYIILLAAIFFSGIMIAQEAQKNFINYQGVARNGADQLMANESMTIGIALKMGSATGASAYAENHSVTTDANGVFSLKIGNGESVSGAFNTIPWGSEATFVTVLVNGSEIGTTEMMAVPYALSSGDGSQSATEVPYDNAVSGLTATNAQEAIDELAGSGAVDADADPTNEFQTLSFDAITNELSLTDGNSITIPTGGTDGDADATNEIQNLTLAGTNLEISGGTGVDLAALIPPGGTDDQNASEVPFDNSTSTLTATDTQSALVELATGGLVDTDDQALVLTRDLLTIEDGAGSVDLSAYIDDPDATTETGILTGDGATVSGLVGTSDGQVAKWNAGTNTWEAGTDATGGGGSSLWSENGDDLFYEDGNVGIGTNDVRASLHVKENSTPVQPLLTLEEEGDDFARIAIRNEGVPALWNIMGRSYDPAAGAEISNINFRYINGLGGQEDVMTIAGNRRVGINTLTPEANLDVVGTIRSSDLAGAGERNVLADADGNLSMQT